jgi:NitT/TauT family transport system substrate-binding protein
MTPNVISGGLGVLDMARARTLVQVNAEAYGIANPPSAESLFTDRYLPPASERRV